MLWGGKISKSKYHLQLNTLHLNDAKVFRNHFLCLLIFTVTLEREQVFKSDWIQTFALPLTNCGYLGKSG